MSQMGPLRKVFCHEIDAAFVAGVDARAQSWVRASHAELDAPLWRAVAEWLASDWPFGSVEYAPRA